VARSATAQHAAECAPKRSGAAHSRAGRARSGQGHAWKEYGWLALVGAILIGAVLVVRAHAPALTRYIGSNPVEGVALFLVLNVLDAVIAPGATLPLIPVAAHAWGTTAAALVTTAGWTTGSLVAFLIARRWGTPIVKKVTSMERVRQMKCYIPQDVFWTTVTLRLFLPMDVLSYVLGLFSHITVGKYIAATALGVAPPAFLLAHLGKLPHAYEFIAFGVGTVVVVGYIVTTRRGLRKSGGRK
jgi:uncharacterized membrane protein YdjX (TVP38/TMEM64 family)